MKRFFILMIMAAYLSGCGKGDEPTPVDPTPGNGGGNPGSGNGNGNGGNGNKPIIVYQEDRAISYTNVLDASHQNVTAVTIKVYGKKDMKYSVANGDVSVRAKNIEQGKVSLEKSDYAQRFYLTNALQLGQTVGDSTSNACVIITDPAEKDSNSNQIAHLLFFYNDNVTGAGSIGFQTNVKFGANETMSAADANNKVNRKDLRVQ